MRNSQVVVLAQAFLARFFESEATVGRTELRESFFWLVGALAAPGLLFVFYSQFYWHFAARGRNPAGALHASVLYDTALYLTVTMAVTGVISIATRNALVVDRRDALILGALPVSSLTIVTAKLMALTAYVGILSLGMHAGAAVIYGIAISGLQEGTTIGRGALAHLVSGTAASMFVFLLVVAMESTGVALVGPRRFARAAGAVQLLLLVAIGTALLLTPAIARAAGAAAGRAEITDWTAYVPSLWFLGLHETLSGPGRGMSARVDTAIRAFTSVLLIVAVSYPISSHRVLRSAATEGGTAQRRSRRPTRFGLVGVLAEAPDIQAALQFLTATTSRVGRFRLIMAAALGVAAVAGILASLLWTAGEWTLGAWALRPDVLLLAVPLLVSIPIVAGWRVVAAIPSELNANWIFATTPVDALAGRSAVARLTCLAGVLVPVALVAPVWMTTWGVVASVPFVVNTLLAGGILVEAHLWGYTGMPCTRPLAASDANLQGRWPFYVFALVVYTLALPVIEASLQGWVSRSVVMAALAIAFAVVRHLSLSATRFNLATDDHRGLILLGLTFHPASPTAPPASASLAKEVPRA